MYSPTYAKCSLFQAPERAGQSSACICRRGLSQNHHYVARKPNLLQIKSSQAHISHLGAFSDINMAEGEGFEPPEDVNPQRFSRPPRSTALPSFRNTMKYAVCRIHTACEVPCGCSHAALCSRTSVFRSRSFRAKSRRSAGLWQDYWMINPFTTKIFISGFA